MIPSARRTTYGIPRVRERHLCYEYFGEDMDVLFQGLEEDAAAMKPCYREITVDIPEELDIDETENAVCGYLVDLGYKCMREPRKDETTRTVKLTVVF